MKITQKMVRELERPNDGSVIHYDDELKGFGVGITYAGRIAFILNYCTHGRERRMTIGRFPTWTADEARAQAKELRKRIDLGEDPLDERQQKRDEPTIEQLAEDYKESEVFRRKRSKRNDLQMLKDYIVVPPLKDLRVSAVKVDVKRLHGSLKDKPYAANRTLALLSRMFMLAMEDGLRADNPCRGVERYPERERQFWLTPPQIRALFGALDAYPDQNAADAIRLLLLTGGRAMEVLHAEWSEFDLKRGFWNKPAQRVKDDEHPPLNDLALAVLRRMKKNATGRFLFPGLKAGKPRARIHRPWVQVCRAAGLAKNVPVMGRRGKPLDNWKPILRLHDLRHTFASTLVSYGVSLELIGGLLGHSDPNTTKRYSHIADNALRAASNKLGKEFGRAWVN